MASKTLSVELVFSGGSSKDGSDTVHTPVGKITLSLWHWNSFVISGRVQLLLLLKTQPHIPSSFPGYYD